MKQNKLILWVSGIVSIILLVVLDQYTKHLAVLHLKDQPDIPIIKNIFELAYVENRGAAFGMMQNQRFFFIILTFIVVGLLLWIFHKVPLKGRFLPLRGTLVCLIAGALGNLIDRTMQGFVVDFLYFKLIDFPVFNVADIYVTCSVAVLALLILFYYKEEEMDEILKVGR